MKVINPCHLLLALTRTPAAAGDLGDAVQLLQAQMGFVNPGLLGKHKESQKLLVLKMYGVCLVQAGGCVGQRVYPGPGQQRKHPEVLLSRGLSRSECLEGTWQVEAWSFLGRRNDG